MYVFYSDASPIGTPTHKNDESIQWEMVDDLPSNVIHNLNWMIPMAKSFQAGNENKPFKLVQL